MLHHDYIPGQTDEIEMMVTGWKEPGSLLVSFPPPALKLTWISVHRQDI